MANYVLELIEYLNDVHAKNTANEERNEGRSYENPKYPGIAKHLADEIDKKLPFKKNKRGRRPVNTLTDKI